MLIKQRVDADEALQKSEQVEFLAKKVHEEYLQRKKAADEASRRAARQQVKSQQAVELPSLVIPSVPDAALIAPISDKNTISSSPPSKSSTTHTAPQENSVAARITYRTPLKGRLLPVKKNDYF